MEPTESRQEDSWVGRKQLIVQIRNICDSNLHCWMNYSKIHKHILRKRIKIYTQGSI